jgi:hypothetical protein
VFINVKTKREARTPGKTDGDITLCSTVRLSAVIILPDVLASLFIRFLSTHIFKVTAERSAPALSVQHYFHGLLFCEGTDRGIQPSS